MKVLDCSQVYNDTWLITFDGQPKHAYSNKRLSIGEDYQFDFEYSDNPKVYPSIKKHTK